MDELLLQSLCCELICSNNFQLPAMSEENRRIYCFESFQVDPARRRLLHAGRPVQIHSKTFDLLLVLVENSGRELEKDKLLELVWPNQVVEEGNLTVKMSALRKILGERKGEARFIVTIPGRGYRFVADVKQLVPEGDALVFERHAVTHVVVEEERESFTETNRLTTTSAALRRLPSPVPANLTKTSAVKIWAAVAGLGLLLVVAGIAISRYFGTTVSPPPFEHIAVSRQTTTGKVLAATISPNGEFFAFAQDESEGRSLWLKHLPTGDSTRIAEPKPVEYWGITFTPDSHHIYATTFEKSQADPVLTKISVLGGVAQSLPVVTNAAVSFAPSGGRMAYVVSSRASGGSILWTADVDGSNKKSVALRKDPNYFAMQESTVAWSPEGDLLACVVLNNTGQGFYMTVVAYGANDGKEKHLTDKRWNFVTSVAWAADGRGLFLTGNDAQGVPPQVWHISTGNGATRRITNDLSSYSGVSLARQGDVLLTVQTDSNSGIWTARTNADATPADFQENFSEVGEIVAVGWTPERKLVYQSAASGAQELWRLDSDKRARQFTVGSLVSDFAVSPDGRYVVVVSNRGGKPNLWRLNGADGGDPKQLTEGDGEVHPRFAADGNFVFFQKGFGSVKASVWRVPIEGGEAQQLIPPHNSFPDVSPDGKQIVSSNMDPSSGGAAQWRLAVSATESGKLLQSFPLPPTVTNRFTRWTPDGRGLTYIRTVGGVSNLWLQPVSGGEARQISNFGTHRIEAFDWSRDGKSLAVIRNLAMSDAVLVRDSARP
jgi:DNA-binding winged helix-turn-helix (wHTH) protein/Tol biopolymer transport system component